MIFIEYKNIRYVHAWRIDWIVFHNLYILCLKSLKYLYVVWSLNCQIIPLIALVALKSIYRAADIKTNDGLHAKNWDHREAYLAETDGEEGKETLVCARQSGVGFDLEECEPYHADVQAEFVEFITKYCEQVEDLRVSGTCSSAFGAHKIGRPKRR